jgi:hypothetical protein
MSAVMQNPHALDPVSGARRMPGDVAARSEGAALAILTSVPIRPRAAGRSVRRPFPWNTSTGVVTALAGLAGSPGSADGMGRTARFSFPWGVAVDGVGSVYVADTWNYTIRKITSSGVVTTVAGLAGSSGSVDERAAPRDSRLPGLLRLIAVAPCMSVMALTPFIP